MLWANANDLVALRALRSELEENRQMLEGARSGYTPFVSVTDLEFEQLSVRSSDLLKGALQLRTNFGERMFALEKDETSSSLSAKTTSSKGSKRSNSSEVRAKAVAEAAKRKVDWEYAKIEMQKKVELKIKEYEIEEMQKKKFYEQAEAEAIAIAKMEEEQEEKRLVPEILNDIRSEIEKEESVREYLSTLPSPLHNPENTVTTSVSAATFTVAPKLSSSTSPVVQGTPVIKSSVLDPSGLSDGAVNRHQNTVTNAVSAVTSTIVPNPSSLPIPIVHGCEPANLRPVMRTTLSPSATPLMPLYTQSAMPTHSTPIYPAVDQREITQVLAESFRTARMPPPNLTVFNGNPLDSPTWKSAFETVIEKRAVNSSEKILYLLQY